MLNKLVLISIIFFIFAFIFKELSGITTPIITTIGKVYAHLDKDELEAIREIVSKECKK